MVTTTLTITDTGKRRTSSGSAEETDIVNSGSAVSLHGVEISVRDAALLNQNASVGKLSSGAATMFTFGEVDHFGIEKPVWTIRGVLDVDSATDMASYFYIRQMVRTKGYKTLAGDLPDWADGDDDASTVNVRVLSTNFVHRSNTNIIDYTLTMVETE